MAIAIEQHKRDSKNSQALRALLYAALLVLASCVAAQAQSGRNVRHQESASTPTKDDNTTRTPPDKPSTTPPSRRDFTFLVTRYVQSPTVTVETSIAFNSFVERLSRSSAVEVVPVSKEVTRKEAIDRAKKEEKENSYVVWLRIEVDTFDAELATAGVPLNPGCLFVSYTVYSPRTAKVKAQGKVYQPGYAPDACLAKTGNPIPRREPLHLPNEYRIRIAGRSSADRVLQAFNLSLPPDH